MDERTAQSGRSAKADTSLSSVVPPWRTPAVILVCGCLIARKLHISQPTLSEHMKILCQAGLTRPKRIKKWTFYKRDESRIKQIKQAILSKV